MNEFFQSLFSLLTEPPGNLIYHLVLLVSIIGAWMVAISHFAISRAPQSRRLIIGFSLLGCLRLILFILGGLAWQGLIEEHFLLPPVDRAVTLLSLILIIWMWLAPSPSRLTDLATWLLSLSIIILFILSLVWWGDQKGAIAFNSTWPDLATNFFSATLLLFAILFLTMRKGEAWGYGLGMLSLLLAGHIVYPLLRPGSGDYPAVIRLTQMAAYPLLLALPQRFSHPASAHLPPTRINSFLLSFQTDPKLIKSLLELGSELGSERLCKAIIRVISATLPAEIGLLLSPPDTQGNLVIHCGFDQVRESPLEGASLAAQSLPQVYAAFVNSQQLELASGENSPDHLVLARLFGISSAGPLLFTPILDEDGEPLAGLLFLAPYSKRSWSVSERAQLDDLLPSLAQVLHRSLHLTRLESELESTRQALQAARVENQELLQEIHTLHAASNNRYYQTTDLAAQTSAQAGTLTALPDLPREQESFQSLPFPQSSSENDYLEGELRLALEEIARLKGALLEADQQLLELKNQLSGSHLTSEQNQAIALTLQELRQSMSSIVGYTDFLLSESVGILGGLQRKFLERVKLSTERMNRLVEDLAQITSAKDNRHLISFEPVALDEIIVEAVADTSAQIREKNITLRLDLADELPHIHTDRIALRQVLTSLLDNARQVTPPNKEIVLRTVVQKDDRDQKYVFLQISDQGGGIPINDVPRVFARLPHREGRAIQGVGAEDNNLYIVKMLVETLEGRIWVDSEPGVGATFSVLLPVAPTSLSGNGSGGLFA